jgi:hypothetical protein
MENCVQDFKVKYWRLGTTTKLSLAQIESRFSRLDPKGLHKIPQRKKKGRKGRLFANGRAPYDAGNQSQQPTASQQQQQGFDQEQTVSARLGNLTLEKAEIQFFHGADPAHAHAPPLVKGFVIEFEKKLLRVLRNLTAIILEVLQGFG